MNVTVKKKPRKQVDVSSPPASGDSDRPTAISDSRWDRIARKAFELWEERGRQDGQALRDGLDAEAIVMEQIHASPQ